MSEALPKPRHRVFAALYDRFDHVDDRRMGPLRRALLRGVHGRVLEIGCGTGSNLAVYDWPDIDRFEGTEPDPFMLRRARDKLGAMTPEVRDKVTLTEAPAEALPFEDGQFDYAVSCLVLCSVSDVERTLRELRRVLKPGGELRLLEHVARDGGWGTVQSMVQPVYGWVSAGCRLDRRTEESVREAGFSLEISERTSFGPLHPMFLGTATRPP